MAEKTAANDAKASSQTEPQDQDEEAAAHVEGAVSDEATEIERLTAHATSLALQISRHLNELIAARDETAAIQAIVDNQDQLIAQLRSENVQLHDGIAARTSTIDQLNRSLELFERQMHRLVSFSLTSAQSEIDREKSEMTNALRAAIDQQRSLAGGSVRS